MNHRLSVALELFPVPPWTEQLAKRQFLFAAKMASEQSWSSITGHWTCATGWQSNFDNLPSRKRGRPFIKWDDNFHCHISLPPKKVLEVNSCSLSTVTGESNC